MHSIVLFLSVVLVSAAQAQSVPPVIFSESWESVPVGIQMPTGDVGDLVAADQGTWVLGDTISDDPPFCGLLSSPHLLEIRQEPGAKILELTSVDTESACADNVFFFFQAGPPFNSGVAIPLAPDTAISFNASGTLENPELGFSGCFLPPCYDAIALDVIDNNGNRIAYIIDKALGAQAASEGSYREIFLNPTATSHQRDLFADFSTLPDFNPIGASVLGMNFEIDEHGSASLDALVVPEPRTTLLQLAALGVLGGLNLLRVTGKRRSTFQ